jgi:uncharacterized protein YeeX (DUF496 family)
MEIEITKSEAQIKAEAALAENWKLLKAEGAEISKLQKELREREGKIRDLQQKRLVLGQELQKGINETRFIQS